MRISDWSSDVCSSDLRYFCHQNPDFEFELKRSLADYPATHHLRHPRSAGKADRQVSQCSYRHISEALRLQRIAVPAELINGTNINPADIHQHAHHGGIVAAAARDEKRAGTLGKLAKRELARMDGEGRQGRCPVGKGEAAHRLNGEILAIKNLGRWMIKPGMVKHGRENSFIDPDKIGS